MKSQRNKTIDFPIEKAGEYVEKCIKEENALQIIPDSVVIGDSFKALKKIKDGSVDLLIVDPPYNMNKVFHGNGFKKMAQSEYAEYTREWIKAVMPKLKQTASIYVCCDWESALVIGPILTEFFILRNRITWQREKGRGAKSNFKNSMEDVFFATVSDHYKFNLKSVMHRRKVLAPYKENGEAKDWFETGRYSSSILVNVRKYRTPHSKTRKTDCKTHFSKFRRRRFGVGSICRKWNDRGSSKKTWQNVYQFRAKPTLLRLVSV